MSALLVGYARCSTDQQDLTAQRDGLAALGVASNRVYVEHGLTGTNRERPGLREALAACREGDTLVVTKLDRLARSLPDARAIAELTTRQPGALDLQEVNPAKSIYEWDHLYVWAIQCTIGLCPRLQLSPSRKRAETWRRSLTAFELSTRLSTSPGVAVAWQQSSTPTTSIESSSSPRTWPTSGPLKQREPRCKQLVRRRSPGSRSRPISA